jgi:EF-P beta-lysylation protein EpmB
MQATTKKAVLWRQIQKENFHSLKALIEYLEISSDLQKALLDRSHFPLNLPKRLAEKIEKNSLEDPIFRQFVPLKDEKETLPGFVLDPVEDQSFCKSSKMLQKYEGRALLLTTSACAMNCRFCFRQNFPYETKESSFTKEIEILKEDASIHEVILSGGDPLSLSDETLSFLFSSLEEISHIQRIRFHTRFPIGIPERIDDSFLSCLAQSSKQIFFVIHCNHPNELDEDVILSLKKVLRLGIPVLSQSVLLKGVNDNPEILLSLYEKLINAGVIPYYLHELDPVQGASHFLVSQEKAISLIQYLQTKISGYGVPRLAKEEPHRKSKTLIPCS